MTKKIPDVFVIVFSLVLLAAAATWVLPGGRYERRQEKVGDSVREVAVPGSFSVQAARPQTVEVFTAPMKGFLRLADIIAFIFVVGGSFFILNETGAIAAGIRQLVRKLAGREYMVIPIVMTFFSFFGAVFGMCEEAMPFVLIFVPLALALGYDSLVGVSLSFLAAGVGFAGAFINPFTLQIAQGLAGVPLLSGMLYRVVIWAVMTTLVIVWVMVYAARIKADPRRSPMFDLDEPRRRELAQAQQEHAVFSWRDGAGLGILFAGVAGMIIGVVRFHWYIVELAGLFFAMGVAAGVVAGMSPDRIARAFVAGCKDIAGAALIVGFAGGILVILENGNVMDTLLHAMASVTGQLPNVLAAHVMYLVQMAVNFFIPSGSTKAALTMPLMAPLADLSGITRQTAVLAYQFGDGFTNMIIPTSGVTVGTLAMAKIPFERWARWHWPMQLSFVGASLLFLAYAAATGWQG